MIVTLSNGTATHGRDYFGMPSQQLMFLPGQQSKAVTIRPLQDRQNEGPENFRITASPVNASIHSASAVAGIIEYQPPRELRVEPASVVEGGSDTRTAAAPSLPDPDSPSAGGPGDSNANPPPATPPQWFFNPFT